MTKIKTTVENPRLAVLKNSLGKTPALNKAFEKIYNDNKGDWQAIEKVLEKNESFDPAVIKKLAFVNELGNWSADNNKLMSRLAGMRATNSMRDIALNFNKEGIKDLVKPEELPEGETITSYADKLYNNLYEKETTGVIINMLRDPEVPLLNNETGKYIANLLSKAPEFNIRTTSALTLINQEQLFSGLPEPKKKEVVAELKTLQRLSLISPEARAVPALRSKNYVSALAVAELPRPQFMATMKDTGLSEGTLNYIHAEAENRKINNEQILIKIKEAGEGTGIGIIDGIGIGNIMYPPGTEVKDELIKNNLSWNLLFGDADFCECGECTSVYSASAYFVDLLQYLRNNNLDPNNPNTGSNGIAKTPLEKLFARRPDLGNLELTCKNTNTILPYVDLVNEIMEQYVAFKTTKAFNVADETSGELLSAPQHTERDHAYQALKDAEFPFTLPYHQPIDAARIFLAHLNSSRHELIKTFPSARNLEKGMEPTKEGGRVGNTPITYKESPFEIATVDRLHEDYLQRAFDAEFLNIIPEEYFALTKESFVSKEYWDTQFFVGGAHGIHTDEEYQVKIGAVPLEKYYGYNNKADMLSIDEANKLGLTFVKTQFLPRTGITLPELIEILKTQYINPPSLPGGISIVGGPAALTDPPSCNLDEVRLKVGTSQLAEKRYDKLHRFIRLWRKLGFTVDETDKAILALGNGEITPRLLHQLTAVKKIMNRTGITLTKLLCFWSDISTAGENSLYKQLFLSHNLLAMDDVFKEVNGTFLNNAGLMSDHLPAVIAALNLSADDIATVLRFESLPVDLPMTIQSLSLLYRYRLLSKSLGLRIPAFVKLLPLFGNVFRDADTTWQFLVTWDKIEEAGFTAEQLNYIIAGTDNEKKSFAPSRKEAIVLTKKIYDGLNAVESEHADLEADQAATTTTQKQQSLEEKATTELARSKASLLFDSATVDQIMSILNATEDFTVTVPKNLDIDWPVPNILETKVKYDKAAGILTISGVLTASEITAFNNLQTKAIPAAGGNPGVPAGPLDASWYNGLQEVIQIQTKQEGDMRKLFPPVLSGIFANNQQTLDSFCKIGKPANKRLLFIQGFLPYLRTELTNRIIIDELSNASGLEKSILQSLTKNILQVGTSSLFNEIATVRVSNFPLFKQAFLIPQLESEYNFIIKDKNIQPFINGNKISFTTNPDVNGEWWSLQSEPLQAGNVYFLSIPDNPVAAVPNPLIGLKEVYWKTPITKPSPIPNAQLIPQEAFDLCMGALTALRKISKLITIFKLSGDEINYLHKNIDFESPDPDTTQPIPLDFNELKLESFLRIIDYCGMRNSLPRTGMNILEFWKWIKDPGSDPAKLSEKIEELTGWKKERIDKLIHPTHFNIGKPKDYLNEKNLLRLREALAVADKTGMDINKLFDWAVPTTNFVSCETIADSIQKAIRAQYNQTDWEQVVKPLNDQLRQNQKTALIAYLLQTEEMKKAHVTDANGLFEYFLIDVEMDTCMETSRIKQAISSVQLFVQRCFIGLEESIPPSLLDRKRWEWMERYRIWEANRKVFLYPENWIESNLRDDKSSFFKELESELLQKDINRQNVADILKTYLYKVDEVANMEVIGLYVEDEKADDLKWSKGAKLHVFARTRNAPYFFYYRYLDLNEMNWYPWEKMQVDIPSYDVEDPATHRITGSGCYLSPVVWNGRLLIFFPQFMKKTKPDPQNDGKTIKELADKNTAQSRPIEVWEIKLAWSEYRNGKWTPKQLSKDCLYDDGTPSTVYDPALEGLRVAAVNAAGAAKTAKDKSDQALSNMFQALDVYHDTLAIDDFFTYMAKLYKKLFYAPASEKPGIVAEIATVVIPTPIGPVPGPGYFSYVQNKKNAQPGAKANWEQKLQENDTATQELDTANQAAEAADKAYNDALKKTYTTNTIADISKFRFVPAFSSSNVNEQLLGIKVFNSFLGDKNNTSTNKVFEIGIFEFNGSYITGKTKTYPGQTDDEFTVFHHKAYQYGGENFPYMSSFQQSFELDNLKFPDKSRTTYTLYRTYPINFHHSFSHQMLGAINSGNPDSFFTFFNNRKSTIDMPEIFGYYDYDQNLKPDLYHELKRPYSLYNWELFFHTPLMIADALSKAQQYEEAMKWFHYVFNPIADGTEDNRFWQFAPFKEVNSKNILEQVFKSLKGGTTSNAISEWRNNPFKPHLVARSRPVAYMKWIVMKYIDNLLDWGDYLFRQDTIESINQATQLYVLAGHILGPKPVMIPKRHDNKSQTFLSLLDKWDAFSNAVSELEVVALSGVKEYTGIKDAAPTSNVFGTPSSLYFCLPKNPKLLGYWDMVADRLFKIRHCLNIEGVFRKLPLFEPSIDPGLLVKAAAQGLSISSVINDLNTPMPNYRFYYLLQKAFELCNELKSLGGSMLSAIEKKDNEAIVLLRARHEGTMNNMMMDIKKLQLEESQKSLDSLYQNRKAPEARMKYYLQLIGEDIGKAPGTDSDFTDLPNSIEKPIDESGLRLSKYEKEDVDKSTEAADLQIGIGVAEVLASIMHAIPLVAADVKPFGLGAGASFGGSNLGQLTQAIARGMQTASSHLSFQSAHAAKKGGFQRALQERIMQANAAGYEIKQIDKQITAQQIRINITNQEISNQQKLIDNANEVEDFLKNKYTNEELYMWMRGSLKTLYRQVYNLAFDLAKKAEKTYSFEKGISNASYIQPGYFDAGREGLLSGEQLYVGLKQLEAAHQEKRGYDYEITKHISLRQLNPLALLQLKEAGKCEFELPETLFDMDYPGHFKRRIKSVAVSIPCIAGPYTSVNATLRLLSNKFRNSSIFTNYPEKTDGTEERFISYNIPVTAIATSSAQNDAGMFELIFKDERYLPFEGAGAISTWRLELPAIKQFNYNSISDVVLHVRFTASEGGEQLKIAASSAVNTVLTGRESLFALIDLKHDMSNEWNVLKKTGAANIKIDKSSLSYLAQGRNTVISEVVFVAKLKNEPTSLDIAVDTTVPHVPGVIIPPTVLSRVDELKLYRGSNVGIAVDSMFNLSIPQEVNNLEELVMIVIYGF
jgi:hypothetical protein